MEPETIARKISRGEWLDDDTLDMMWPDVQEAVAALDEHPLTKFELDPMDLWRLFNEVRQRRAAERA